ncbi:MAG: DUF4160 domain-containing protein [Methylobacter sp.]
MQLVQFFNLPPVFELPAKLISSSWSKLTEYTLCLPLACLTASSFVFTSMMMPHKLPHIHAKYQGQEASFSITDGEILSGGIPMAKTRLVQAWIEIHRESLLADWDLAVNGQAPFPIDPLR